MKRHFLTLASLALVAGCGTPSNQTTPVAFQNTTSASAVNATSFNRDALEGMEAQCLDHSTIGTPQFFHPRIVEIDGLTMKPSSEPDIYAFTFNYLINTQYELVNGNTASHSYQTTCTGVFDASTQQVPEIHVQMHQIDPVK